MSTIELTESDGVFEWAAERAPNNQTGYHAVPNLYDLNGVRLPHITFTLNNFLTQKNDDPTKLFTEMLKGIQHRANTWNQKVNLFLEPTHTESRIYTDVLKHENLSYRENGRSPFNWGCRGIMVEFLPGHTIDIQEN